VQDKQFRLRTGGDRVGPAFVIAELDEQSLVVKLLYDRADPRASCCAGSSVSNATTSKTNGLSFFASFSPSSAPNR
jgi:hypothetical protein